MNDPGLDGPINETSHIEDERKEEAEAEKEDEQAFLNPRSKRTAESLKFVSC